MAAKALNFKMDEAEISEMREIADIFNITLTDLIKVAVRRYMDELKKEPSYRLTKYARSASKEECEEILSKIYSLTDDELSIESSKHILV